MQFNKNNMTIERLIEEYKLSEDEHQRIGNIINQNMLFGKVTSQNPVAIIDIGPPGSGKTGLNGYAVNQFAEEGIVVVNNDELRPYHPMADEIARLYPEYYNKVTNEDSKFWTDDLVEKAIEARVNVLYEGTGRKIEIFKRMISKMQGYKIIVRAMAVNELNCLMSIVERYEGQVREKGWGRIVSASTFYKAYDDEMLNTIDTFERTGMVRGVEVYMRGLKPSEPVRIYGSDTKEFINAKLAVQYGREKDRVSADRYYREKFSQMEFESKDLIEVKEILERINYLFRKNEMER